MENNETGKKVGKKKLVMIVAVSALALGGMGYKVYANNQYKEQITEAISLTQSTHKTLDATESKLLSFYENDDQEFLMKDVAVTDIEELIKELDKLKVPSFDVSSEELSSELKLVTRAKSDFDLIGATLVSKAMQQDAINTYFQKGPAVNGSSIKYDLVIMDDLEKPSLVLAPETEKSEWNEAMKKVMANATTQYDQIKKVTVQVDNFFKDKKVVDKIDDKLVKSTQEEVKKIKNEKARKAQEARLKQVTDEVATRKAAVSKAKAEAEVNEKGGTVVADADGNYHVEAVTHAEVAATYQNTQTYSDNQPYNNGASNAGVDYSSNTSGGSVSNNTGGGTTSGNTGGSSSAGNTSSGSTGGNTGGSSSSGNTSGGTITGNQTGGGDVTDNGASNSATGGGNTWTGGDFDGSGIPDW